MKTEIEKCLFVAEVLDFLIKQNSKIQETRNIQKIEQQSKGSLRSISSIDTETA